MSGTAASLEEYILGYCSQSAEAEEYARGHLARLVKTLEMTPAGGPADCALEMGAYMQVTPALHHRLGYGDVRGCDLGPFGEIVEKNIASASGERFRCLIDLFNAETDRFPYPNEHFQLVLCCEVLEHLNEDPMAMMAEINRVTKTGGYLVLTTPNICSARGVAAILTGWQPQHFSQYLRPKADASEESDSGGVWSRLRRLVARLTGKPGAAGEAVDPKHSREYAPRELPDLLHNSGFEPVSLETGPCGSRDLSEFDWVLPSLKKWGYPTELRGEGIYVVGRKTEPVRERYPPWLYA